MTMSLLPLFQPPLSLKQARRNEKKPGNHHICATAPVVPKRKPLNLSISSKRRISKQAVSAIRDMYMYANGALHRGSCAHALGRQASELMQAARTDVAHIIGADHWKEIAFAPSIYAASTVLAQSLGSTLRKGDHVLLSSIESDHTIIPWRIAARQRGFKLKFFRPDMSDGGKFVFEQFASLISSKTKLIVMQHASPIFGAFNPLDDFIGFAQCCGVPVAIDATFSLPWTRLDVQKMKCDFLLADCASIGAPNGSAFLYGRMERFERLPPVLGGDDTFEQVYDGKLKEMLARDYFNWAPVPERFEVGFPSLVVGSGLAAALREHHRLLEDESDAKGAELGTQLYNELKSCPFARVYGSAAAPRIPIMSFSAVDVDGAALADELCAQGAVVDNGFHDASIAHHEELNLASSLRVSFDPRIHDEEDVSDFVRLLTSTSKSLNMS